MARLLATGVLGLLAASCASPHIGPSGMTAAEHDRAASGHVSAAKEQYGQYDPHHRPSLPCLLMGVHNRSGDCGTRNETSEHREAAELEQRRAGEHASAAAGLRGAETRACRGLSDADRDDGPLTGRRHAFTAQPLIDYDDQATAFGVVMTFGRSPLDVDGLQAAVECHRARIASRGRPAEPHDCPLDDAALSAVVIATSHGTLLQLRSDDPAVARRAWESARRSSRASQALRPPLPVRSTGGS